MSAFTASHPHTDRSVLQRGARDKRHSCDLFAIRTWHRKLLAVFDSVRHRVILVAVSGLTSQPESTPQLSQMDGVTPQARGNPSEFSPTLHRWFSTMFDARQLRAMSCRACVDLMAMTELANVPAGLICVKRTRERRASVSTGDGWSLLRWR